MWPSMTESVPFLCDDIKEMIQSLKGIMKYWAHLYNTDNSFIHVNPSARFSAQQYNAAIGPESKGYICRLTSPHQS